MGQRMCKCTNVVFYSVLCGLVSQVARNCHLGGIGRTRYVHPWVRTTWAAMCVLWANTHTGCQVMHLVPVSTKQGRFQSKLVCEPFARALHVHPAPQSAKPYGTREQTWRPTSVPKLVLPSQKLTEREHFTIKMAPPLPLKGCTMHPSWVPTKRMVCGGWGHPYHLQQAVV